MNSEDQIKVETAMDILLVLLYGRNHQRIAGITKLEKLVYLLEKETSLNELIARNFKYEPYHFGPYSAEVLDNIGALEALDLVKATLVPSKSYVEEADRDQVGAQVEESDANVVEGNKNMEVYELTDDGIKVANALFHSLDPQKQKEITELKDRFNDANLRQLLRYVYRKYPESTTESKIKDYVMA
jgi:uncharacterized protein YwgA